jgi:hypothetical protein
LHIHNRPTPERRYYAEPSLLEGAELRSAPRESTAFVATPFDPLRSDRKRTRRLFDYSYRLECCLSAWKRKFGYFALPLLYIGPNARLPSSASSTASEGFSSRGGCRLNRPVPSARAFHASKLHTSKRTADWKSRSERRSRGRRRQSARLSGLRGLDMPGPVVDC